MTEKLEPYSIRLRPDQITYLKTLKNASQWLRDIIDQGRIENETTISSNQLIQLSTQRTRHQETIEKIKKKPDYMQIKAFLEEYDLMKNYIQGGEQTFSILSQIIGPQYTEYGYRINREYDDEKNMVVFTFEQGLTPHPICEFPVSVEYTPVMKAIHENYRGLWDGFSKEKEKYDSCLEKINTTESLEPVYRKIMQSYKQEIQNIETKIKEIDQKILAS